MGNIFVASDECLRINYDYEEGIFKVKLRDDFDTLDKDVKLVKAYKILTLLEDKLAHRAMNVPYSYSFDAGKSPKLAFFRFNSFRIGRTLDFLENALYPLRSSRSIRTIANSLSIKLGIRFRLLRKNALTLMRKDRSHQDWMTQNEELLTMYIESVAGEKSAEEAIAIWPFLVKAGV
ncbi:hypothetical protein N7507_005003 [Penicillium longicatenatum]|nr:hypothetical protein N7507_005003 [Penicillium longicatenatum]